MATKWHPGKHSKKHFLTAQTFSKKEIDFKFQIGQIPSRHRQFTVIKMFLRMEITRDK